jgi:2-C-methyl-D-erythritol 4-phosphate cytidylyltransferase
MDYSICLLAAGKGSRTQLDYNKVFYHLDPEHTVLDVILDVFVQDKECRQILVVAAEYEKEKVERMLSGKDERVEVVCGGATRQQSVWNALQHVDQEYVLIHDAARPYLKREVLERLKRQLHEDDAALLMVPAVDTIKTVDELGYVTKTLKRSQVWHAQTPQAFKTSLIKECHEKAIEKQFEGTDDAQLVELFSKTLVKAVRSDPANTKITLPSDLRYSFDF